MNRRAVYLVDSSIYVFRAWFTLPDSIRDAHDRPANAVYGFIDFVATLLDQVQSLPLGFAFDESLIDSFRNSLYPLYKANREPAPEELLCQFNYCRAFISALGLPCFSSSQFEADDLIGTVAHHQRQNGSAITILSSDKDLAQLIGPNDTLWDYAKNRYFDMQQVTTRFGVRPEQIPDQLALAGDTVDNIPGVPGIGMATAAKLLSKFNFIEDLLSNVARVSTMKMRGAVRVRELLEAHIELIPIYKQLTTIACSVPLPEHIVELEKQPVDHARLNALFDELRFGPLRRERWQRTIHTLRAA